MNSDDPQVQALVAHYRGLLAQVYGERHWILVGDVMAGQTVTASALAELGAASAFCLAAHRGVGPLPEPPFAARQLILGLEPAASLIDGIRASIEAMAALPDDVIAAVDAFDPDRQCSVIAPFFGDERPIAGRQVWAARPDAWRVLEDKTIVDPLWDALGVPREPSTLVSAGADVDDLWAASEAMNRYGDGAIWAGDSREGFNGGAEYVRWVRSRADAVAVAEFFAPRCDTVRVMPFLEGVPCSIHGIVFDDAEIALRPCEMVVLRKVGQTRFHYAGSSTYWDPPAADRQALRQLARRVGRALRDRVGYRGVFTVDGVMTARGFRPTELNPRFGGAIGQLGKRIPELPLLLLHFAVIERPELDWRPAELEGLLVGLGDTYRAAVAMGVVEREIDENVTCGVRFVDGAPELLDDPDDPTSQWTVWLGPGPVGGFLRVVPAFDKIAAGPHYAPRAAEVLNFLDRTWALGLGRLEAARDVRD